jgi:hypothetical protein
MELSEDDGVVGEGKSERPVFTMYRVSKADLRLCSSTEHVHGFSRLTHLLILSITSTNVVL